MARLKSAKVKLFDGVVYGLAHPSLHRMSELLYTIPCGIQSVPEWIVPGAARYRIVDPVDSVLHVPVAAQSEPLELGRTETLRSIQFGTPPRIRFSR